MLFRVSLSLGLILLGLWNRAVEQHHSKEVARLGRGVTAEDGDFARDPARVFGDDFAESIALDS